MNTSGLLKSLQVTRGIHDSMNLPKIEFKSYVVSYFVCASSDDWHADSPGSCMLIYAISSKMSCSSLYYLNEIIVTDTTS